VNTQGENQENAQIHLPTIILNKSYIVTFTPNVTMKNLLSLLCLLLLNISLSAQKFYKTPSGAKYHLATCHMVKNVSQEITLAEAAEKNLEPCKICHPQAIVPLQLSNANKAKGQDATVQCKGLTKKGTRCQHHTKIGNGYCYQHQP